MEIILIHCHSLECGGHFRGNRTTTKVLQLRFYWHSMFKDDYAFISTCDMCQSMGNISRRDEGLLKGILEVKLFDV